jgi:hypothetical protein
MKGTMIFTNVGKRTIVSRPQFIIIAVICFCMMVALLFNLPNVEGINGKIIIGIIVVINIVGLIFTVPWISKFRANVVATDEGISFENQFFSWTEVTRLSSWFGGRIDVYIKKGDASFIFCFGAVLNSKEFQAGYKHVYAELVSAREAYLNRFKNSHR